MSGPWDQNDPAMELQQAGGCVEGFPARLPHPISQAGQDYNDPATDSLFVKLDETMNRCSICGARVYNNTESRDAHLSEKGCHENARDLCGEDGQSDTPPPAGELKGAFTLLRELDVWGWELAEMVHRRDGSPQHIEPFKECDAWLCRETRALHLRIEELVATDTPKPPERCERCGNDLSDEDGLMNPDLSTRLCDECEATPAGALSCPRCDGKGDTGWPPRECPQCQGTGAL